MIYRRAKTTSNASCTRYEHRIFEACPCCEKRRVEPDCLGLCEYCYIGSLEAYKDGLLDRLQELRLELETLKQKCADSSSHTDAKKVP